MKFNSTLLFIVFVSILGACSATKKAEKNIKSGNYNEAFEIGYTELSENKNNDDLVKAFKKAYDKANESDLKQIELLKTQNNSSSLKKIYALYSQLDARQYQVISLQPLYVGSKEVDFNIVDYSSQIANAKNEYSKYLYNTANEKMKLGKTEARDAYQLYSDLEYLNPSFVANLSELVQNAKTKGSSLVLVNLTNHVVASTQQEDIADLMRFGESSFDNPWVIYHQTKEKNTAYDFEINVILNKINITPEQVNSEVIPQQARVVDGWEYVLDANGNVKKDSLGNDLKRDKIIIVQAEIRAFQQLKVGQIEGSANVKNLKTNTQINNTPIVGEAKFENQYGLYRGDQRAIEQKYYELLQNKEVPFPTDPEFVKYSIADYKAKLLNYINQQQF